MTYTLFFHEFLYLKCLYMICFQSEGVHKAEVCGIQGNVHELCKSSSRQELQRIATSAVSKLWLLCLAICFHLAPLASGYTLHRKLQQNKSLDPAEVEEGLTYESYLSNRYLVLTGTYSSTSCHVLIVAVRRWKMDFRLRVKKPSSEPI